MDELEHMMAEAVDAADAVPGREYYMPGDTIGTHGDKVRIVGRQGRRVLVPPPPPGCTWA